MARQETRYLCEMCGAKYLVRKDAEQCENQHFNPTEIIDVVYDVKDKKEYPIKINVSMKNKNGMEKIITYSRK